MHVHATHLAGAEAFGLLLRNLLSVEGRSALVLFQRAKK